jgi:hypothetical protein
VVESSGGLLGPSGFLLANGGFLHGIMMGLCALANSRQVLLGYLVLVILELAARNAVFACLFFWRPGEEVSFTPSAGSSSASSAAMGMNGSTLAVSI